MRGEVEIWDGDKLLHKESNLLVDGAGELLAEIMTVSPSLSGIEDHATSSILDSSNYTIQAISFGKDASAYTLNAHAIPEKRNLWYNSTPSAEDSQVNFNYDLIVSSCPNIAPPPQYSHIPSSIAHVLSLEDKNASGNSQLTMNAYNNVNYSDTTVSAGQDNWICASFYIKFPVDESSLVPTQDSPTTNLHPRSHLGLSILGEGRDLSIPAGYGGLGYSRLATAVNWNDVGTTPTADGSSPSSIKFDYISAAEVGTARSEGSGYSINNWQQNGGVYPVGNGWHRIYATGLAPVSGVSGIGVSIYPIGWEDGPVGETEGGIYMYGAQLELGRWPTDMDFTNNRRTNNWDFSGSVLNRDHSPGAVTDNGTVRVVPPYGTSSYVPTNYLSNPPNPASTRVEEGNTALLDVSSDALTNFDMGQNLNVIPYRKNPGGAYGVGPVEGSQRLLPHNVADGQQQIDWAEAYATGYSVLREASGMDSFGPQAYYLGCYPEGSSTGGSNWALVSSLDNSAAYLQVANGTDPNFVSGTYNSIVNEASSMDVSGFVGKVYDAKNKVGDLPNPNLLFYTDDPGSSPGLDFPAGDTNGYYWHSNVLYNPTFSSILETNPFGGPSSIDLSAAIGDGTVPAYWPYLATRDNNTIIGYGQLPGRPRQWRAADRVAHTWYVKRPTRNLAASGFFINTYDPDTPFKSNIVSFEYLGGYHESTSAVPTLVSEPESGLSSILESVGNDWYRCGVVTSGLGTGASGGTTVEGENLQTYFYIGGDEVYASYAETSGQSIWLSSPQCEQWPLESSISSTPYQEVAGVSATIAEQNGTGGLHVSGGIDATNSGTVEYSMLLGSGDVGYSNLYGGIYNMGLWTIDMRETLRAGNTPPYSFGPLDNPRKYRLFATKHLTKNLGYIRDRGGFAGSLNYSDLTIKWRLHFL